ncbi:MerR family transcriptional regulator [Niallia taxi]|uniref:MerR family transcriptional regulator n=1 Tax=Niallia taxi TaxID=2499688 RepID=A0A3S2TTY3_9BACI|nr:MerR family transcriptional regulator [Niallia taxi]MCM3213470.1 MerR family transcriptional regulator [Niallia taxi]MDK8640688.1 MerR family transcriptional regulator [Niallia taxi]MED4036152.1 MerR family transcriptional regulator [Niallia taxi]MED4056506.1 MerR family transcriptional regulator [Niallia taxi]MED4118654.1 MerR family transcriptional regulator [Niallia taxi]
MRIGKVAELSGLSSRTIDYYTQIGLLEVQRSSSNYRLYPEDVLETLKRIKILKQQRMSMEEIKEVLQSDVSVDIEPIICDVQDEINCLQKKLSLLEEKLKNVPPEEKLKVYKRIEPKMTAIMTLLALL